MINGTYQYTQHSFLTLLAHFSKEVCISLTFHGEELFEKYYKVYSSKRGEYFKYKNEKIYLKQFV